MDYGLAANKILFYGLKFLASATNSCRKAGAHSEAYRNRATRPGRERHCATTATPPPVQRLNAGSRCRAGPAHTCTHFACYLIGRPQQTPLDRPRLPDSLVSKSPSPNGRRGRLPSKPARSLPVLLAGTQLSRHRRGRRGACPEP